MFQSLYQKLFGSGGRKKGDKSYLAGQGRSYCFRLISDFIWRSVFLLGTFLFYRMVVQEGEGKQLGDYYFSYLFWG